MNKVTQSIYKNKVDKLEERGSGGATLDDIVDSQGNKRFIEGSGTLAVVTGLTANYNKWSLSGTHLMLVLGGVIERDISAKTTLCSFSLPLWVFDKINITYTFGSGIDIKQINMFAGSNTKVTSKLCSIIKNTTNSTIDIMLLEEIKEISTTGLNQWFRMQFDLLIDSE